MADKKDTAVSPTEAALAARKATLEKQLAKVDEALAALKAHPEFAGMRQLMKEAGVGVV